MADAFAEYVHKRIRGELGFAAEEARDHDEMLARGYRGSRCSFGCPACRSLVDQRSYCFRRTAQANWHNR